MSATLRKSSLSPPGDFRTQVSALASIYHLQQGKTNPEYLIVLRKTYPLGGKKDSNDMQGYLTYGFIAFAGALLNMCPYVQFY